MSSLLIYGANGYTGRLIAREAAQRGLAPILAGRNRAAVEELAASLQCESRSFGLDDDGQLAAGLRGLRVALNCAGPFSRTAPKLMEACLRAGAAYLDITGEIEVIEQAAALDGRARAAGVVVMPAVGFDVVPTDCVAAMLAQAMPDATHLTLAFTGTGVMSPGTMKTAVEGIPHGGRVRRDGRIERVPAMWKTREVPFPGGTLQATTIPWGDVASAFHTTGIPNIETYLAMPPRDAARLRRLQWFTPLLKLPPVVKLLQFVLSKSMRGPDESELADGHAEVWGEVRNAAGRTMTAAITTPNPYRLTALTAVAAAQRVLAGDVAPGFQTPARALGGDFVLSIPGVELVRSPS